MPTWTLMKKELRLLSRDWLAAIILLVLPFLFMLIMGFVLGVAFGQTPDNRVRVSVVDLDSGYIDRPAAIREGMAWFTLQPGIGSFPAGASPHELGALAFAHQNHTAQFPYRPWSRVVIN